jgi:hypothetical protein
MSKGITQRQRSSVLFVSVVQAFFQVMELYEHVRRGIVQTAKNLLKKCKVDNTDIELALLMARCILRQKIYHNRQKDYSNIRFAGQFQFVEEQQVDLKKLTTQIDFRSTHQAQTRIWIMRKHSSPRGSKRVVLRRNNQKRHCTTVV